MHAGTKDNCKIIFLEGPIQTGKSTLVRCLTGTMFEDGIAGGYTSQRLLDENGKTVAFRIGEAGEPLSRDLSEQQQISGMKGVFKYTDAEGKMHIEKDFFNTTGVEILSELRKNAESGQFKLLVLDEIGGHELADDKYRHELEALLTCGIPCIGVIKSEDNMARMLSRKPEKGKELLELNRNLHEFITHEASGKILYFDRKGAPETVKTAETEIKKLLKTYSVRD